MHVYFSLFFIATFVPVTPWSFQEFFGEQTEKITTFFEEQREEVSNFVNKGYEDAVKMKESAQSYLEEQQKKIADDLNSYVKDIKYNGRKVADSWSYSPDKETESTMYNPDEVLTAPAIISRHGYTCETHTIISQGYVLNLHRIPRSKNGENIPAKTVFLQHGLFGSSVDWILNVPDKALAYVLADAGYDVWMSNIRGNRYSREHTYLKSASKSYWDFSWHDIAQHDIPAALDYIIKLKGSDTKITYIGHSMGTTILFAMLTLHPEYNELLTAGFALAPVVFLSEMKSPLKSLAPIASNVAYMEMLYGSHEFIPKQSALAKIYSSCSSDNIDPAVCKNVVFYICGFNEKQFNKTVLPVFLSHLGTGTSWKTVVHFSQEIISNGRFQKFDYGPYRNMDIYGTETPPEYDLSKITLPISLFWSKNDLLSSEHDVKLLYNKLQSRKEMYLVPDPEFNHLDYLWAIDAPRLLNNKLLEYLERAFMLPRHESTELNGVRQHTTDSPFIKHLRFLTLRM